MCIILKRVKYQLTCFDAFDNYSKGVWALVKSKKLSFSGRCCGATVAILLGEFWLLHNILKQGEEVPSWRSIDKRPESWRATGLQWTELNRQYKNGGGVMSLIDFIFFHPLSHYRWNSKLIPKQTEPSYRNWEPSSDAMLEDQIVLERQREKSKPAIVEHKISVHTER